MALLLCLLPFSLRLRRLPLLSSTFSIHTHAMTSDIALATITEHLINHLGLQLLLFFLHPHGHFPFACPPYYSGIPSRNHEQRRKVFTKSYADTHERYLSPLRETIIPYLDKTAWQA